MISHHEIQQFEEMNFNTWPALKTAYYDGWLLRSSGGDTRRANSVNPWSRGSLTLGERITDAEAIYARWGHKAIFRLTPLADDGLDDALAARGYTIEAPTFMQLAEATPLRAAANVQLFERPENEWIEAATGIRAIIGSAVDIFSAQHRAVGVEGRWALIRDAGRPVAIGVTAIERRWSGIHSIYVHKSARRKGYARLITEALIGAAHARGARHVWLQVEQANASALPLYDSLGFQTAYSYHYRVRA